MREADDDKFARAVRVYRAYYGLDQTDLAELTGLSTATISKIERNVGRRREKSLEPLRQLLADAEYVKHAPSEEGALRVHQLIVEHGLTFDVALTLRATNGNP